MNADYNDVTLNEARNTEENLPVEILDLENSWWMEKMGTVLGTNREISCTQCLLIFLSY